MLKIGEFSQLANVSIRALRFYHEAGLLEPSHIDPSTNYRSYEPKQLRELRDIRLYKAMGLSLAEIHELLRERPSPTELRETLRERRTLLKRRIQDDLERLARIEAQMNAAGGGARKTGWHIEMREIQPVWVAAYRKKIGAYEEADHLFGEIECRMGPELLAGKRAALWHTCLNERPQIDCEAFRFLRHPSSPKRGIDVYQMPATRVASIFHAGADNTIPQAYKAVQEWLERSNFVSRGPKCEVYWIEPHKGSEAESLTEIRLPVFPRGGRSRLQSRAA